MLMCCFGVSSHRRSDAEFFKKQAEWWRDWATLTASPDERAQRQHLADWYERLAKEHETKEKGRPR